MIFLRVRGSQGCIFRDPVRQSSGPSVCGLVIVPAGFKASSLIPLSRALKPPHHNVLSAINQVHGFAGYGGFVLTTGRSMGLNNALVRTHTIY